MAKSKTTKLVCLTLCFLSYLFVYSQERALAQINEPKTEIRKAYEKLKVTSWRLNLTISDEDSMPESLPFRTIKYEHTAPDKYRISSPGVAVAFLGGPPAEFVFIGQKTYVKRGNSDWEISTEEIQPERQISSGRYREYLNMNFRLAGVEVLNNLKVNVYFHEEIQTVNSEDDFNTSTLKKTAQLKRTTTYWIDQTDGLLLKFELKDTKDERGIFQLIQSTTENYEYDKSIRIEPPVIKKLR